jgi:hypothetical protein
MAIARAVPDALREAVTRWKVAGSPQQPPSPWSLSMWQSRFAEHGAYLAELPSRIGRIDVSKCCAEAPSNPDQATRAFIAAMIWG